MRRDAENDQLRNAYLGTENVNAQQQGKFAANQEQRAATQEKQQEETLKARHRYLVADAIEKSADPVAAVQQYAPEMVADYEQHFGQGSFAQLTPEQLKAQMGE